MASEPEAVVARIQELAHGTPAGAPRMLQHPPGDGEPLPSVHQAEELAAVHRAWAQLGTTEREAHGEPGSVRARVRARVTTAAAEAALAAGHADRSLLGDVIRAVDLLARRVDEVGQRLVQLERVVGELVVVTGEDLTRIRAALVPPPTPRAQPTPRSQASPRDD